MYILYLVFYFILLSLLYVLDSLSFAPRGTSFIDKKLRDLLQANFPGHRQKMMSKS